MGTHLLLSEQTWKKHLWFTPRFVPSLSEAKCTYWYKCHQQYNSRTPEKIAIINLLLWLNLPFRLCLKWHVGSFNSCMPPQSPLFPTIESSISLLKTPPMGTSPSKLLYDRLSICNGKAARNFGISPDKLFSVKSNSCRPLSEINVQGIAPWKWFPCNCGDSNVKQAPSGAWYLTR